MSTFSPEMKSKRKRYSVQIKGFILIMSNVESNLKTNVWRCAFFLHYLWHFLKNNKSSSKHRHSTIDQPCKNHLTYIKIYCSCIISDVHCNIRSHIPRFWDQWRDWIIKAYIDAIIISALLTISEYCCLNELNAIMEGRKNSEIQQKNIVWQTFW